MVTGNGQGSGANPITGTNLMFVADLPVSLIGDVVTLPKTVTSGRADPLLRTSEPGLALSPLGTDARADLTR